MSDIYLAISETPTVVTLTSAVINSAVASSVTVMNTVTVALDANSLSALENVTVTVGAAITGTVTVGNFPATQAVSLASVPTHAITGTVTVGNISSLPDSAGNRVVRNFVFGYNYASELPVAVAIDGQSLSVTGTINGLQDGDGNTLGFDRNFPVDVISALPTGSNNIGRVTVDGTVTIGAGTSQIGSVTASLAISSTAITSGSFASLTSATLVPGNVARKMATVYNLGAGQLFVNAGASATTLGGGFMVALSSGDYFECDFTTTTLSALFATAGTCSWMSH